MKSKILKSQYPHQLVLRPDDPIHASASEVIVGNDGDLLLKGLVARLIAPVAGNWENLMDQPQTSGTSSVEIVDPQNIDKTIGGWGLNAQVFEQASRDIKQLIELHASKTVYVSQQFQYNVPGCHGGQLPVCMQTLMVVARQIHLADTPGITPAPSHGDIPHEAPRPRLPDTPHPHSTLHKAVAIELRHIYVESFSNAKQQFVWRHWCHSCRLVSRCCHDAKDPRPFTPEEMLTIQNVLSMSQALWSNDHMPVDQSFLSLSTQEMSSPQQLRRFVKNAVENKEVFKVHDETLLKTLQGSMQSSQQRTRSFNLQIKERDLTLLDRLVAPCLQKAGIQESIRELWGRTQYGLHHPFSLECQFLKQVQVVEDPPSPGCNKSTVTTVNTQYSWILLWPHREIIDTTFMASEVDARHLECVPLPDPHNGTDRGPGRNCIHMEDQKNPWIPQEGSIVRWSIPLEEGRFHPVQYLVQWPAYSSYINKAAMDIMRYASAMAFLRITVSDKSFDVSDESAALTSVFPSGKELEAIGAGLSSIAEGWKSIASVIGPSVSETVRRQVCLGFEKYEHTVKALHASGIEQERFVQVVDSLISLAEPQVPDVADLRKAMVVLEYSDNVTWTGETVSYTASNGFHGFFHFYKYVDAATNKISVVFGMLKSDFTIAPDLLIVERKKAGLFGLHRSNTVEYRNVPHILTPNDTAILNTYFEVVAYRKLALVLNQPIPPYPDLSPVCSQQ
ncbi:hypothetical protein BGW42_002403 [Actinomortierella wolfii]|nr:hypothetical protein BGW42_002403 [Actinomortierella wolfii]